ncbi:hypothetical protein LPJ56_007117 [Coemansia sp. RSA 2599]|nr:hypothetical protein LPJ75_007188 [Coemansia sp. RSA 2598]KAJ1802774.1 hypothetical protein LPJ56_007117 [Coemansia sp. RSA 2599]
MSLFHSNTWSRILVRSLADKKPQGFSILPIGSYCAMCTKCEHWNLVSPNIQNALLCTHCEEELRMPLEAHFTCPAVLRSQFAVMRPFDIEQFLASQAYELSAERNQDNEVVAIIGFMDIAIKRIPQCAVCREMYPLDYVPQEKHTCACGSRTARTVSSFKHASRSSSGLWESMTGFLSAAFCAPKSRARVAQSPEPLQNVLAVVAGGSLSCYSINHGCGEKHSKGHRHHDRICHLDLEDSSFELQEAEAAIRGSGFGMRCTMSLGSRDVAKMWHSVLVNQVKAIDRKRQNKIERAIASAVAASSFDAGLSAEAELHSDSSATALRLIPV